MQPFGKFIMMLPLLVVILLSAVITADREYQNSRFQEAMSIRQRQEVAWREQQRTVDLLVQAAGFRVTEQTRDLARLQLLGKKLGTITASGKALEGVHGVEVAEDSHPGAVRELGKVFRDGFGVDVYQNLSVALFKRASELGDPEAQGQMGLRYAFGLQNPSSWGQDGVIAFDEADEEQAMLHYYFAAKSGDSMSSMVLGYRHMHGIGVPKSCWTAATYYQPVAEQVADLSTQPESLPQIERIRLHVQSTQGLQADRQREVVQYYQYSADKGNVDAQTAVAQVLNYGTYGVQRDHGQALHYFERAAASGDPEAMAHLGHMHANGFGTPQSYKTAHDWLKMAADKDSASAQFGLGCLFLHGHAVEEDHDAAFKLFLKAANQGHAEANFYLGLMHAKGHGVRRKNVQKAFQYYSVAAHAGHVLSMYNAAMMQLAGKGTLKSCKPALAILKQLAERSPEAAALQRGHEHFFRAQHSLALISYLEAAEMGMELGQSNAAWLLHRAYVSPGGLRPNVTFNMIRRSADQGNVASLLLMADAYLNGDGVGQDWTRSAAVFYDAFQERSAQAMFNLGFMHEFGVGLSKDLPLARRFYQMARHTQPDAFLAVQIAMLWLKVHEVWDALLPYVPEQLQPFWRRALTLQPPYTSVMGSWGAVMQAALPTNAFLHAEAVLGRIASVLQLPAIMGALLPSGEDADSDATETTLLIVLVIVLVVVMRARQQRIAARAAPDPAAMQGAPGGGDHAVQRPGEPVAAAQGVGAGID